MAEWRVEAFRLDTDEVPAQSFLDSLEGESRAQALALLTALRQHGNGLRKPHSRALDVMKRLRKMQRALQRRKP